MILGVRSAVICDEVRRRESGQPDYLGVHGVLLEADTQPGFVFGWLALILDTDKKRTPGRLSMEAADFRFSAPFLAAEGERSMSIAFPLVVPVYRAGRLWLTVTDGAPKARPLRLAWKLDFEVGAKVVDEALWRDGLGKAAERTRATAAELAARDEALRAAE